MFLSGQYPSLSIDVKASPAVLAPDLKCPGVDDIGGRALDEIDDIVKSSAKVKLVAVLLDVPDMRRTDAVFQP